jgi:PTS system beta-glucosides-specific IIC component
MNHITLSEKIIAGVDGVCNIGHIECCSTRLRLSLLDNHLVDIAVLEKLPGVLGGKANVQCQVTLGKYAVEVYHVIKQLLQEYAQPEKRRNPQKSGPPVI